ncbi:FlaD/FlaE family flagellar protein [Natrialba taiwanensis]|uniref:Flagella accessory C family protein n=1 Tax=Natrialba taiwanensis DSM 12281 TaxID=1230458 RepID=L9ZTI6_9EURY|nr:FlaD/FlaE family flagellar protein [Natrialba taiwanensis]ELY89401.1 Flagella accessory C family protein [Natrialba taiwanensis DSM 12281]
MVLSIIGNILGDGDDRSGSGNGSDDLVGGDLAGSMSDDELMPGTRTDESVGGSGGGEGSGDGDLFDDGDLGDGGDEFLDDESMSLDGMGEMGDMDEMGDMGEMDAMDGGGDGVSSEIESRVEEMENNVGSLSSTVNTVQSENEKISESLDDIEENIRKLLEVYEMVTQGVNPFVEGDSLTDSMTAGPGGGAPGSGDFGGESLFDSSGDEVEDEAIDDDIASAEADEFLDESIIDDEDGADFEDDGDLEDDLSMDSEEDDDSDLDGETGGDGDLSFDELKSEYESGDANWDEEAGAGEETADEDNGSPALEMDETEPPLEPESDLETDADDLGFDEGEAADAETTESEDDSAIKTADGPIDEADGPSQNAAADTVAPWDDGGRPYLETIPSEYDTEFVVMDWLEYLVDELGLNGAARTLRFYSSIHWVSGSIESHLQTVLNGFGGGPDIGDPDPHSSLGVDHKRSLWWISQIATPEKKRRPFDEWVDAEGIAVQQAMAAAEQHQPEATGTDEEPVDEPVAVEEAPTDVPPADTEGDTAAASAGEELSFDEEPDAASDESEVAEVELDANVDSDGDTATEATDDATADESDDLELEFTTDEPLDPGAGTDPFGEGGDDVADEATGPLTDEPSRARERSDEPEQGERADAADLETNDAQKIFIEEAEDSADSTESVETGGAEPSVGTESMTHSPSDGQRTELAEPEVTDGGQMIWVDSDVVLSASGARLCDTRGNAGRVTDTGGRSERAQPAKPLVSDEPADLDGWQVERIKLLLAPEELEHDRPHDRDRDRTHSRTRDDRVSDTERTTDDHTQQ